MEGKKEIMDCLAPEGGVYQAGTLSGNPVAVTAGLITLKILAKADYKKLDKKAEKLCEGIENVLKRKKIDFCLNRFGSMFTIFFTKEKVVDFKRAKWVIFILFCLRFYCFVFKIFKNFFKPLGRGLRFLFPFP